MRPYFLPLLESEAPEISVHSHFSSLTLESFCVITTAVDRSRIRARAWLFRIPESTYTDARPQNWDTFVSDKMSMWAAMFIITRLWKLCPFGIAHRCKQSKMSMRGYFAYISRSQKHGASKKWVGDQVQLTELPRPVFLCAAPFSTLKLILTRRCVVHRRSECRMRPKNKKKKKNGKPRVENDPNL